MSVPLIGIQEEEEEGRVSQSPRQLAWRQLKKNRFAMIGGLVLCFLYACALFAEFLAPYPVNVQRRDLFLNPPTFPVFHDLEGHFSLRPHIAGMKRDEND